MTTDPAYEVDFDADDKADPQNWPLWYKGLILFVMSYGTTCVVLYSTSYTSAIPGMERSFGATQTEGILGVTTYLLDDEHRALAFSIWSIGPMNGPVLGPVVGGFVYQYLGWRWTNWVVIIAASVAWIVVGLIQETYAPAILRKRAERKRKETGDDRWWSRYDDREDLVPLLKVNLSRPFSMTVTEPILIFWDVYIALVYGVLYLCFVAYPIIFSDMRGWSPGLSGLAFCAA
ncbi:hypothetical protein BTJ68_05673 [Hortaea werneckii EXF-2000]|uniref:Major facilitator superfamily (MFS) profile domain-containing protein n=1 Tax=Hortaea werneckii EXF-2000 TaxID=1157616 RepID=A0A1Z5TA82_HORWE|nr:hypothetical protein BTJ68_05673 [Hortaea werneckii EXF-2000]